MHAVRSVAFAAVALVIVSVGTSAQTTEECSTWLSSSSGAYAFEPFMNCMNRTTAAPDATLINEVVSMVRAAADMHSFGPYVPATRAAVQALNPNEPSRNYERTLLEIERALGTAGDLHLTLSGTPYLDSYFVIRLFRPSVRLAANGQSQELYVHTVLTQATIDSYRQNMQGQNGGTYSVPSHATFAATLNKTIRTVNGIDAIEWARNEVRYLGFFTPSMRLNLGVLGLFNMRLSQVSDLVSARESIVFEDGTTLTYPRIVIKGSEGGSPRCDIGVPRNSVNDVSTPTASSSRRQAAPKLPAGFIAASNDENVNLELRDDSVHTLKHIGDATAAIHTAIRSSVTAASPGAIDAAAPANDVLFSREFTGLGKFQIRSRVQGNVAILTVNSFLPPAPTGGSFGIADIAVIYQNISVLFNESAKRNVNELMIDMSTNAGGYVALQNLYLRAIDAAYNIYWDRATEPQPTLINITNQNVMWSRSYLRRSIQSSPIGDFFVNLLNQSSVYLDNTPLVPGDPVWFDPVGRTRDGWTDPFIRPALFNVPAVTGLFTSIKIVTDGICGSSCCLFMERVKQFGFAGASVEFVGVGGDVADSGFQMGDACGGSVNKMCAATIFAKLQEHPFLTGTTSNHAVDVSFVDSAYFKLKAATTPAQYDMRAFANRVYRNWDAVGASDEAHERRLTYLYGEGIPSSSQQFVVALSMLMAVVAAIAGM